MKTRVNQAAAALLLSWFVVSSRATTWLEDFSSDPATTGWQVFGQQELFAWNQAARNLAVTWDSTRPNSYFSRALGMTLGKDDDFALSFDLVLQDVTVGVNSGKPFTFELAVGFLNWATATQTNFIRGTGTQAAHLVEFDYFPDSGFGASISPTIVSGTGQFVPSFSFPFELTGGDLFHVELRYASSNQTLVTTMLRNGKPFGPIKDVRLGTNFTNFAVDAVAISSYSDTGAGGSVRAHGQIDNITVELPTRPPIPIAGGFANSRWQVGFETRTNWSYTLERTDSSWHPWRPVTSPLAGSGRPQFLVDESDPPPAGSAFYRLRAEIR